MPSSPLPASIFELGGTHKSQSSSALRWRNTSGQTAGYLQLLLLTQRNSRLHLALLLGFYKMVDAAFFHESSLCQSFLYKASECAPLQQTDSHWGARPSGERGVMKARLGLGRHSTMETFTSRWGFRETSKPHCIHSLFCLGNRS